MQSDTLKNTIIFKGLGLATLAAIILLGISTIVLKWYQTDINGNAISILIYSDFVIIPLLMGLLCAWLWKRNHLLFKQVWIHTFSLTAIAIAIAAIFMGEGIVCLAIVSPLLFGFIWLGLFAGYAIFRDNNQTLQISTSLLLLVLFVVDTFSDHHHERLVSDEIRINAPANVVWKFIPEHPYNTNTPDDYWLWRIGLPAPVQSIGGLCVGDARQCVFSNGAIFDEVVSEYEPNERYTFNIVKQPADPEIIGHITLQKGQFLLRENADGSTTLIGNSWYQLHVFPAWYYDWWAQDIVREVHLRVMKHIAVLAEQENARPKAQTLRQQKI